MERKKIIMSCSNCRYFTTKIRMKETRSGLKRIYRQGYCRQWKKLLKIPYPCSKWIWVKDRKYIDLG